MVMRLDNRYHFCYTVHTAFRTDIHGGCGFAKEAYGPLTIDRLDERIGTRLGFFARPVSRVVNRDLAALFRPACLPRQDRLGAIPQIFDI